MTLVSLKERLMYEVGHGAFCLIHLDEEVFVSMQKYFWVKCYLRKLMVLLQSRENMFE